MPLYFLSFPSYIFSLYSTCNSAYSSPRTELWKSILVARSWSSNINPCKEVDGKRALALHDFLVQDMEEERDHRLSALELGAQVMEYAMKLALKSCTRDVMVGKVGATSVEAPQVT